MDEQWNKSSLFSKRKLVDFTLLMNIPLVQTDSPAAGCATTTTTTMATTSATATTTARLSRSIRIITPAEVLEQLTDVASNLVFSFFLPFVKRCRITPYGYRRLKELEYASWKRIKDQFIMGKRSKWNLFRRFLTLDVFVSKSWERFTFRSIVLLRIVFLRIVFFVISSLTIESARMKRW